MKCTACGTENSLYGTQLPVTRTFAGGDVQVVSPVQALQCRECGEATITKGDADASERHAARHLIAVGATGGDVFRFVRKVGLGIPAKDLAALFGVAPDTVSRWEKGERAVPRAEMALLGQLALEAMAGHDDLRDRLQRMAEPGLRPPREVRELAWAAAGDRPAERPGSKTEALARIAVALEQIARQP